MRKISGMYIAIFSAAILLIVGGVIASKVNIEISQPTKGRIDIYTKVLSEKVPFSVYVENSSKPLASPEWMIEWKMQGTVVEKDNATGTSFKIVMDNNSPITLQFRGPDIRNKAGQRIPKWVNYTSVTINGKEILEKPVTVWHDEPFAHQIDAKSGETYNVVARWEKSEDLSK